VSADNTMKIPTQCLKLWVETKLKIIIKIENIIKYCELTSLEFVKIIVTLKVGQVRETESSYVNSVQIGYIDVQYTIWLSYNYRVYCRVDFITICNLRILWPHLVLSFMIIICVFRRIYRFFHRMNRVTCITWELPFPEWCSVFINRCLRAWWSFLNLVHVFISLLYCMYSRRIHCHYYIWWPKWSFPIVWLLWMFILSVSGCVYYYFSVNSTLVYIGLWLKIWD
jgi:hypothetical protein